MDALDTIRSVETPEGINLDLRLAGPVVRALAWAIDCLIKYSALLLGLLVLYLLGATGMGLWLIAIFIAEWFYPVYFEVYRHGATPGKKAMGVKVVSDNGAPLDFSASLIRNLLRAADFLPLLYGFGLICMLLQRDFKRLGDLAAGTVVIYQSRIIPTPTLPPGPDRRPGVLLDAAEQRLLVNFAERSAALSPERRAELAELLHGLTGKSGAAAVEELLANARGLMGSRR